MVNKIVRIKGKVVGRITPKGFVPSPAFQKRVRSFRTRFRKDVAAAKKLKTMKEKREAAREIDIKLKRFRKATGLKI